MNSLPIFRLSSFSSNYRERDYGAARVRDRAGSTPGDGAMTEQHADAGRMRFE